MSNYFGFVFEIDIDAVFICRPLHTISLVATTTSYSNHKIAPAPFRMTRGNNKQSKFYYKGRAEGALIP